MAAASDAGIQIAIRVQEVQLYFAVLMVVASAAYIQAVATRVLEV